MPDPPAQPFKAEESDPWRDQVNGWEWQAAGDEESSKSGECPSCSHAMTIVHAPVTVTSLDVSENARLEEMVKAEPPDEDEVEPYFARCNCGGEHPGRPAELKTGCGSCAYIDPPADE